MNRFSCYVRARLQRRLFVWFGVAILVSGIAFTAVLFAFSAGSGVGFSRDMGKLRFYVGNRFAEVWDEPEARAAIDRFLDALPATIGPVTALKRRLAGLSLLVRLKLKGAI